MRPLHDIIAASFRTATYVKIDETPIRCLEHGKGKAGRGQFWVYHHAEHGVLFDWHNSRANTCLDEILIGKDFEWVFDKLMHDPAPEELPGLLPAAGLKARGEPAMADDTAAA